MHHETTTPCVLTVTSRTPDQVADTLHTGLACVRVEALFRGLGGQAELDRAWQDLQDAPHQPRKNLRIKRVQELFTAKFGYMDRSGWFMGFLWCSSHGAERCIRS